MADKEKKVDEVQETPAEQTAEVERVGEAEKAQSAAVDALPKVEKAEAPKPEKVADKASVKAPKGYKPRLKADYEDRIVQAMTEKFGYKNRFEVPKLAKIVINMGVGEATQDKKRVETAAAEMQAISGQKPVITKAKKSIAQFKLREGMPIGAHVTLRGDRMWEFLDRLLSLALPRIRDFRGLSPKQFDGRGNYTFGLTEQVMFHEIDQDKIDRVRGMDITVVTTATNDAEGRALLRHLGFPFKEA